MSHCEISGLASSHADCQLQEVRETETGWLAMVGSGYVFNSINLKCPLRVLHIVCFYPLFLESTYTPFFFHNASKGTLIDEQLKGHFGRKLFDELDTNKDNVVSEEEAKQAMAKTAAGTAWGTTATGERGRTDGTLTWKNLTGTRESFNPTTVNETEFNDC